MNSTRAKAQPGLETLVICADDFGMDPAADDAILTLAQSKRLNATSCLAECPGVRANAAALRASGLQLGLHLNFTEAFGSGAAATPVSHLIGLAWTRRLRKIEAENRIDAQLDAFEDVLGCRPHFVDGHQHVHQFPVLREVLLGRLVQRYGADTPWLRSTRAGCLRGTPIKQQLKARTIELLGARAFSRRAASLGFRVNQRFFGAYDFQGGEPAYGSLLRGWLAKAQHGDLIMCHPAVRAIPGDVLGQQRVAEFNVLRSEAFSQWLEARGLRLDMPGG